MKRVSLGWCCVLLSGMAMAASPAGDRPRVEASLLVTGWVEIAPTGKVEQYELDQPSKLPPGVVKLIDQSVSGWQFELAETGAAPVAKVRANMSLRMVASQRAKDRYQVRLAAAEFDTPASPGGSSGETLTIRRQPPPDYPQRLARAHVSGTVYLLLQVNRQGKVEKAAAEQVDLATYADDYDMKWWRIELANAAIRGVRQWTFNLPTTGPDAAKSSWLAQVPIQFEVLPGGSMQPSRDYGEWHAYVPGPRSVPAWAESAGGAGDPSAVPTGSLAEVGHGLRLTTPLAGP
ncbi:MAG: energy transducer TonB [Rhodanobacter lindaniclasticus]